MIYTKAGLRKPYFQKSENKVGKWQKIKENSLSILFFTLFLCGILVGSTVWNHSEKLCPILNTIAMNQISEQYNMILLTTAAEAIAFTLLCVFSSVSGLGLTLLIITAFIKGLIEALTASYLITEFAIKGLGYYCILLLPGKIIAATAMITLCAVSGEISKKTASIIFLGENTEIGIREYLLKTAVLTSIMLLSGGIRCLCVRFFSGLF